MSIHTERQYLPYTSAQLFDLVADVERYPEFLPWVSAASIRHRRNNTILVDMTIAAGLLRKQFASVGILDRPHRIEITSADPIFDRFWQCWMFENTSGRGTNVEYHIDFRFRSLVLQILTQSSFADRAATTVKAFERRARQLYGTTS